METERDWSELPRRALVSVMRKLDLDDRLDTVPNVCRAWYLASKNPACWESMLREEQSENAMEYYVTTKSRWMYDYYFRPLPGSGRRTGMFRSVIERSERKMMSLFIFPFLTGPKKGHANQEEVLSIIAESCPNLKHLSLEGVYHASDKAMCRLVRNCRKLEVIDFSDCSCFSPAVVEELGRCCPNFAGFRGQLDDAAAAAVAKHLPGLRCVALCGGGITNGGLLALIKGCTGLQYLSVLMCPALDLDDPSLMAAASGVRYFCAEEANEYLMMIKAYFNMMCRDGRD